MISVRRFFLLIAANCLYVINYSWRNIHRSGRLEVAKGRRRAARYTSLCRHSSPRSQRASGTVCTGRGAGNSRSFRSFIGHVNLVIQRRRCPVISVNDIRRQLHRSPPACLRLCVSMCVSNRLVFVVDRLIARVTSSLQSLNPSSNDLRLWRHFQLKAFLILMRTHRFLIHFAICCSDKPKKKTIKDETDADYATDIQFEK